MESLRSLVRSAMRVVARGLNKATDGKLSPNAVTVFGLFMHLPIALLIASGDLLSAAMMLAVFGLLDTLDGELARLQNRESKFGMFLDSVTDRIKEVLLYIGISYYFVSTHQPMFAVWAIAACGAALLVSYINAWGEVVSTSIKTSDTKLNKTFRNGIMSFDVRMFVLVGGLAFDALVWVVPAVAFLSLITACQRIFLVSRKLKNAKS